MPEPKHTLIFTRRLNERRVRYMVSGSVASSIYGVPRLTLVVDVVVALLRSHIPLLLQAFSPPEFYCPPAEILTIEAARENRGQFNVLHLPSHFRADFYVAGKDSLNLWGLAHCNTVELDGEPLVVAPPEVVIVRKREFYREGGSQKHLQDIRSMLEVTPELTHNRDLDAFIAERGLQNTWQQAQGASGQLS